MEKYNIKFWILLIAGAVCAYFIVDSDNFIRYWALVGEFFGLSTEGLANGYKVVRVVIIGGVCGLAYYFSREKSKDENERQEQPQ
ncbi:hypothetical protein C4J81_03520 [Deltaproteobacteria bacterium Smac51]|nr:hypothetical protein C4J81_03520 [Deltaproteobacteria bacterium Smac51]